MISKINVIICHIYCIYCVFTCRTFCFILVRVTIRPEPILVTLGARREFTGEGTSRQVTNIRWALWQAINWNMYALPDCKERTETLKCIRAFQGLCQDKCGSAVLGLSLITSYSLKLFITETHKEKLSKSRYKICSLQKMKTKTTILTPLVWLPLCACDI